MIFSTHHNSTGASSSHAFTLVEVMMALLLIGLVIPVVVQGLRVASRAGEVAERKALAIRIADRVLSESILNGQYSSSQSGSEKAGPYVFRWSIKDGPWTALSTVGSSSLNGPDSINTTGVSQTVIHQCSVTVAFDAQGKEYSVQASTLVNTAQQ